MPLIKSQILGASTVAAALLSSSVATADHHEEEQPKRAGEFGVFIGAHLFNDDSELGVVDADESDSLQNSLAFGVRAAWHLVSTIDIEGELAIAPTKAREQETDVVAFGWRAHALYHVGEGKLRPFALLGVGALTSSSEDENEILSDTDFAAHAGIGVKYAVEDNWGLRLDARLLATPSSASESLTLESEYFLGLYKNFGNIPKKEEAPDEDGDGIPDAADKCKSEKEDIDGNEDEDGCPEEEDKDSDGILDSADQCIDDAEDMDGFEDGDGCPDADNDHDGIADDKDQCKQEAEDKDQFQDEDGCPDADNDGDGLPDVDDKCPLEAENRNAYQDDDGCPDEIPEAVQAYSGAIEGIRFANGKAKIRPSSFKVLDKAASVIIEYKLKIEVQGHTDNQGDEAQNQELSQERAQAVVDYLVSKGVSADNLRAKGYGSSKPVADNAKKAGQAQNRRVEMQRITD